MPQRRSLIAAAVLGASALAACQLFLDLDLTNETRPDGGGQAGPDAGSCPIAIPPSKPVADGTGAPEHDETPLVFAVREFFFNPPKDSDGITQGWDLDGRCTCTEGAAGACKSASAKPACDDDAGRDLAGNPTFAEYAANVGSTGTSTGPNERIAQGRATMMFEVRNYDGRADDRDVLFWMYPSRGILPTTADGTAFNYVRGEARSPSDYCYVLDDGGCDSFIPPVWNGADRWTRDPTAFLPGGELPAINALTYVRDRTVYMQRPKLPIVISLGPVLVSLTLSDAIVAGRIAKSGAGWTLRGHMHGRISLQEVLTVVGTVRVSGGYLCQNETFFPELKKNVCALADIMTERALDDPNKPCDALSLSIGFRAETAIRGLPLNDFPAASSPCPNLDASCQP